jgi:hypothetical protein
VPIPGWAWSRSTHIRWRWTRSGVWLAASRSSMAVRNRSSHRGWCHGFRASRVQASGQPRTSRSPRQTGAASPSRARSRAPVGTVPAARRSPCHGTDRLRWNLDLQAVTPGRPSVLPPTCVHWAGLLTREADGTVGVLWEFGGWSVPSSTSVGTIDPETRLEERTRPGPAATTLGAEGVPGSWPHTEVDGGPCRYLAAAPPQSPAFLESLDRIGIGPHRLKRILKRAPRLRVSPPTKSVPTGTESSMIGLVVGVSVGVL